MASNQKVVVPAEVKTAIAEARSEAKGPEAFVVISYSNVNTLSVVGAGPGSYEEASKLLPEAECAYIFLRKDMKVEMAKTVKFATLTWVPNTVKPMRRSLITVHKGQIRDVFAPVHVSLDFNEKAEMNEDRIMRELGLLSGTASREKKTGEKKEEVKHEEAPAPKVEEKKEEPKHEEAPKVEEKKEEKKVAAAKPAVTQRFVPSQTGGIGIDDEKAFKEAMASLRDEKKNINWTLLSFVGDNKANHLHFIGAGENLDTMHESLQEGTPCLGLARISELMDQKSKTVKFVHVRYIPATTKPLVKAALTTQKGAIEKSFQPFLLDVTVEKPEELTAKLLEDRVANASGTKSHIIKKN